jgi:hypothetical protein
MWIMAAKGRRKGKTKQMKDYEVFVEDINPCGGAKHAKKKLIEVQAESPEAYVKENGSFPIMEVTKTEDGVIITTGDGSGNFVKYTFTE